MDAWGGEMVWGRDVEVRGGEVVVLTKEVEVWAGEVTGDVVW